MQEFDEIEVWRNENGGSYSLIKTYGDESTIYHYDYGRSTNVTYGYKVRICRIGEGCGDFSGHSSKTLWADTLSVTVSCTPLESSQSDALLVEVTCTPSATHAVTISDTFTATVTCTPSIKDGQSVTPDYAYYYGLSSGEVCLTSEDYQGDKGEVITATWISKVTDFSDQFPGWADKYKCVYSIKLIYEDLEATSITMFISGDGGNTWESSNSSVGSGDGKTKAKEFFFMKHGQYFQFKIIHASSSKSFKWLGLEVEIEEAGDYFSVN
jgi:hypothetical protein